MMPRIDPTTQPERDRAERGYTATVASVGGGSGSISERHCIVSVSDIRSFRLASRQAVLEFHRSPCVLDEPYPARPVAWL
jgi:hypothetical protein